MPFISTTGYFKLIRIMYIMRHTYIFFRNSVDTTTTYLIWKLAKSFLKQNYFELSLRNDVVLCKNTPDLYKHRAGTRGHTRITFIDLLLRI